MVAAVTASAAADGVVEIPLGTVVRSAPGVETELASTAVPTELVGQECRVESRAENNSSVHPGNDLRVATGSSAVVLPDVEGLPGKVTAAAETVRLGPTVTITLVMGPHGVFSAGASAVVVLQCAPPPSSTTSTSTSSTSSTSTTTSSSSTTVAPPSSTVPPTTPTVLTETTISVPPTTPTVLTETTISVPPTVTTVPPPDELAFTGSARTWVLLIAGLVLVDVGYLVATLRHPVPASRRS